MNRTLQYFGLGCFFLGSLIYVLQKLDVALPKVIHNHLNDFLIIPIVLYFSLVILRWTRNEKKLFLKLPIVLYVCFLYSILFEYIFPIYLERYTKDYIDILLYLLGGLLFYLLQTRKKQ